MLAGRPTWRLPACNRPVWRSCMQPGCTHTLAACDADLVCHSCCRSPLLTPIAPSAIMSPLTPDHMPPTHPPAHSPTHPPAQGAQRLPAAGGAAAAAPQGRRAAQPGQGGADVPPRGAGGLRHHAGEAAGWQPRLAHITVPCKAQMKSTKAILCVNSRQAQQHRGCVLCTSLLQPC
jgi:hypothetical protein